MILGSIYFELALAACWLGTAAGLALHWFRSRAMISGIKLQLDEKILEIDRSQNKLVEAQNLIVALNRDLGSLQAKSDSLFNQLKEERQFYRENEERITHQFKSLAGETLKDTNASLIKVAESMLNRYRDESKGSAKLAEQQIAQLITPIKDSLVKVDEKIQVMEKVRHGAYQSLKDQVVHLMEAQSNWHKEATRLSQALTSPVAKGRWGEIQLRRVVELSGMLSYCDFYEQESLKDESGQRVRPDMVIKLPGNRQIVLDAKAPLGSYFKAMEAESSEQQIKLLSEHSELVRRQVVQLGQKAYWNHFSPTPEFVILFLPGEHYFSAALEADGSLIEFGVDNKVIIATPTTLIALLRSIAYSWKQEELAQNAKEISALGEEMYHRICDFTGHFSDIARGLNTAIEAYNKSIWTIDKRILTTAKKFRKLGVGHTKKSLSPLKEIEKQPKMKEGITLESVDSNL